jgi:hypothetical protein
LADTCISIITYGADAYLDVSNSASCSAGTLIYTITVEGFVRQLGTNFRLLSSHSTFNIIFSYDNACGGSLIYPPGASNGFIRNQAVFYYNIRQTLTLPSLAIDYSGYHLNNDCGSLWDIWSDTNFAISVS